MSGCKCGAYTGSKIIMGESIVVEIGANVHGAADCPTHRVRVSVPGCGGEMNDAAWNILRREIEQGLIELQRARRATKGGTGK